ncbi:MAG TPA: CPBP family intramembrane glutamic endopeptidase [Chthoniobacterales bacterium]|jgi:membrane protease YdiL (CAAX protease family)|nr:CPBP family intramembrane glutamic endopeptidase [Chthoniobacterales bacterium]
MLSTPPPIPEPRPAVWGPIITILWGVLVAFAFLIAQSLAAGIYLAIRLGPGRLGDLQPALQSLKSDGTFFAVCTFATLFVCTPLVLGIIKLKNGSRLADYLGLRRPSLRQLAKWTALTIGTCVIMDLVLWLAQQPIVPPFMREAYPSADPRWLLWLALAVAAPVFEEIFFRGFLFAGLAASRLRWSGAILITAALWAAIHVQYDWYGISIIFVLGLLLGTARALTRSTVLTIWLHCMINIIATAETAFVLREA